MARISLEVSIGEALDKYSILCIKEEHIVDTFKKKAIQLEKETIYPSIEPYLHTCKQLYEQLYHVNLNIWNLVDLAREKGTTDPVVMKENDARFRIKRKINEKSNSYLKEQKNFHTKPISIFITNSPHEKNIKWIYDLSVYFDEVHVYTPNPVAWEFLHTEDPDIQIFFALKKPECCQWATYFYQEPVDS